MQKKHLGSSLPMPVLVLWSNTNKGQIRKDFFAFLKQTKIQKVRPLQFWATLFTQKKI